MFTAARRPLLALVLMALSTAPRVFAQDPPSSDRELRVNPTSLSLRVGEKARLTTQVVDRSGAVLDEEVFFFSRARRAVRVDPNGEVEALGPGSYSVVVRTARKTGDTLTVIVPVEIAELPIEAVQILAPPGDLYQGTRVAAQVRVLNEAGGEPTDAAVRLTSSAPHIASVDEFGSISAHAVGRFTLTAQVGGVQSSADLRVVVNPVQRITLECSPGGPVRTGDVVHCQARCEDGRGGAVEGVPVFFSLFAQPSDRLGPGATGQVEQDGRFVAEQPGRYTVVAHCGGAVAQHTLQVIPRGVERKIEVIGHGSVFDVHTSDLWVWEGADGRDYAVTGTWGADGEALFWDVTDPTDLKRIAKVKVDARTVNDVKVSADGSLCAISREGASNRRNGVVLIDVARPAEPKILAAFDDELTGGVHNLFIYEQHVFALSAGRRYDVINIEDPTRPHRVGNYELASAGHSIHDVWVEDGIAYSSNWSDGVHMVDVGKGIAGGSPENPVRIASYAYPSGWNHAAFPYRDAQTGKFYIIAGDEAFPYGLYIEDKPTWPRGWLHFIDFTDPEYPREVARFQVPEAGTHNFWVEGDVLYAAFYNGGLRIVDISGELMGDLYRQGREIAWFIPTHHEAKIPNAPMVWGPQPHKGHIFLSDWNSGLWAVKLVDEGADR